jgi:hypothetical protein
MSMMKPDANQTTSMGMMEIMGARTGRLRESNALSVSVASARYGSCPRPVMEQKSVNVRDFPFVGAGSGSGVCVLRMLKRRHQGGTAVVPKYLFINQSRYLSGRIEATL